MKTLQDLMTETIFPVLSITALPVEIILFIAEIFGLFLPTKKPPMKAPMIKIIAKIIKLIL